MSPGLFAPGTNQAPFIQRQLITWSARNTNASPIGWINDQDNETWGNNVDAHLDRNADDAPDLPRPRGEPFRVFDFPFDPTQNPNTYQKAAVVQLFYWCNWMHDTLYDLGFTEADRVENIRRVGEVAKLMTDCGLIVLCSFISPYRSERLMVRHLVEEGMFVEVFVDTPLEECMRRARVIDAQSRVWRFERSSKYGFQLTMGTLPRLFPETSAPRS
jgi:hypothetical protein